MKLKITLLSILISISGCSSKVYVKTETAPNNYISKNSYFYVAIMESNSIEEQKALNDLKTVLKQKGYQFATEPNKIDFYFAITMDTPSYSSTSSIPITSPNTTNYSGFVGNDYYSGSTTTYQTTHIPITTIQSYKKSYLNLYKYNKSTGKGRLVWSAFSSIDAKKYKRYETQIMSVLVSHLGKDYEGDVALNRQ